MKKVSVIIPVFNVAPFLPTCLNSCLNSTLQEIEFICVNDGSTDNSLDILQQYAQKDPRFTILSQENMGQGVARNKAIQMAQGEYIAFVDPDDYIEPTLFEKTYNFALQNQADVVQFDYTEYRENTHKYKKINLAKKFKKEYHFNLNKKGKYTKQDIPYGLFYNLYNQVWNRLYRKDLILKNNIHFSNTRNGEDQLFTIGVLIFANEIHYLNDYLYTYRVRQGSSCHSYVDADIDYAFKNIAQIEAYLRSHNIYDTYLPQMSEYRVQSLYWVRSKLRPEMIEKFETEIKKILSKEEFDSYTKLCFPRKGILKFFARLRGN